MSTGKLIRLFEAQIENTIEEIKTQIEDMEGIPKKEITLIFNGRIMIDYLTLAFYNV